MPVVAHYPLDEDAGSTARDVHGGHDGSIQGSMTLGEPGILGTTAYYFPGDAYVNTGYQPGFGTGAFSISFWITPKTQGSSSPGGDRTHVSNFDGSNGVIVQHDEGQLRFWVGGDDLHGPALDTGRWQHVCAVATDSAMSLYVDGVEIASQARAADANSTDPMHIGARPGGTREVDGKMTNVELVDHALSPAEIAARFQAAQHGQYVSDLRPLSAVTPAEDLAATVDTRLDGQDGRLWVRMDTTGDGRVDTVSDAILLGQGEAEYAVTGATGDVHQVGFRTEFDTQDVAAGPRLLSVGISKAGDSTTRSWMLADASTPPTSESQGGATTRTQQRVAGGPASQATTTDGSQTLGRLTAAPGAESTTTTAAHALAEYRVGVSTPALRRIMEMATAATGLRTETIEQQQALAGAIEHNDTTRDTALELERTYHDIRRRVPSPTSLRLRAFATHTNSHDEPLAWAHSEALVEARVRDETYPLAVLRAATSAPAATRNATYVDATVLASLATWLREAPSPIGPAVAGAVLGRDVTDTTYSEGPAAAAAWGDRHPVQVDTYPLVQPAVSTVGSEAAGDTYAQHAVLDVVEGRSLARATRQPLVVPTMDVLGLALDAATPHELLWVRPDLMIDGGEEAVFMPEDAASGMDLTQDVSFGNNGGMNLQ